MNRQAREIAVAVALHRVGMPAQVVDQTCGRSSEKADPAHQFVDRTQQWLFAASNS